MLNVVLNVQTSFAVSDDERNENMRINSDWVCKRMKARAAHGRPVILACYGPSLKETWPEIKLEIAKGADVITCSGAHKFLVEKGIIPKAHIDCDPRHDGSHLGKAQDETQYLLASCVSPNYVKRLTGYHLSLWHLYNGESSKFIMDEPAEGDDVFMVTGGGSVGLRSINLLHDICGYRKFHIHGMDSSFEDEGVTHAGEHMPTSDKYVKVKCGPRWFLTNASFISYAQQFQPAINNFPGAVFKLHGDGLLQQMQKEFLT